MITFNEAIQCYLKFIDMKNKQSTYRTISNRINNYILPYFSDCDIYTFSVSDYLNWQFKINELDLKYNYKKNLHITFVIFLNFCIKFYNLDRNVASIVGNFKNDDVDDIGNIWSYDDFKNFISCVDDIIYKTLFELLFFTGLRLGECLGLTFNDIDNDVLYINKTATRFFKNNNRVYNKPKTKSSIRKIKIDNHLISSINELKIFYKNNYNNFSNDFYIFGGVKSIPPTTLTRKKDYYCSLSNTKRIKIHEFRHSHACLLFQNNIPIDEISYRLGHSNISMTLDIYLKYLPKNEIKTLDLLNSLT